MDEVYTRTKNGIPVYFDPHHEYTASILTNSIRIIVGANFKTLSSEEQAFIIHHEEGHIIHGFTHLAPPEKMFEIEHNCDRHACENTSLKAALGALDNMIERNKRLDFLTDHLEQRRAELEKLYSK